MDRDDRLVLLFLDIVKGGFYKRNKEGKKRTYGSFGIVIFCLFFFYLLACNKIATTAPSQGADGQRPSVGCVDGDCQHLPST
jgi:hypothetical protein